MCDISIFTLSEHGNGHYWFCRISPLNQSPLSMSRGSFTYESCVKKGQHEKRNKVYVSECNVIKRLQIVIDYQNCIGANQEPDNSLVCRVKRGAARLYITRKRPGNVTCIIPANEMEILYQQGYTVQLLFRLRHDTLQNHPQFTANQNDAFPQCNNRLITQPREKCPFLFIVRRGPHVAHWEPCIAFIYLLHLFPVVIAESVPIRECCYWRVVCPPDPIASPAIWSNTMTMKKKHGRSSQVSLKQRILCEGFFFFTIFLLFGEFYGRSCG